MQPISYQALTRTVRPAYLWLELFGLSIVLAAAGFVYMGHEHLYGSDSHRATIAGLVIFASLLFAAVFSIPTLYTYNRRHDRKLEAFASDNNWLRMKSDHESALPIPVQDLYDYLLVNFDIVGTYQELPMRLIQVDCNPKDLKTVIKLVCLKFSINRAMPAIMLLSEHDKLSLSDSFLTNPPGRRTLQLEGDFNTVYQLHVCQNKETEALEVLTPDVMDSLMCIADPSSIGFDGYEVALFVPGSDFNQVNLSRLFSTADAVIAIFKLDA